MKTYESVIMDLLKARSRDKTICPSEVLPAEQKNDKILMEKVRAAARRLVAQGKILFLQGGREIDPSTAKGPVRLKLAPTPLDE